jgi:hypothetical protein
MDVNEMLNGVNNLASIEEGLFDVARVPLYPPTLEAFNSEFKGDATDLVRPDAFAIYRTTGGDPLGYVGKDFRPTQPRELFTQFVECLKEVDGIDLNKVRYRELKEGAKIQFSVSLQSITFRNRAKVGDDIETRLVITTGFDGFTKTTLNLETLRLICINGMTALKSHAKVSFKNTKGNFGKLGIACEQVSKVASRVTEFKELFIQFDSREVTKKEVDDYVKAVFGYSNAEREELGTAKTKRLDAIMTSFDLEMSRSGNTVWGMLNGVTHFTNHVADTRNREDYVFSGGGLLLNNKAQAEAINLIS